MNTDRTKIQVTRSSLPGLEEYIEEIKGLWDSYRLTNMGEKHRRLEEELIHYLKAQNITLFSNGHLALEYVLEAFELTGEVITTPFTFASTVHAIVRNGLKPVFCDITLEDYTIDTGKIEALINENTTAIVPVHVYGNLCNHLELERIAQKYNLKIIYDAAHAFGVKSEDCVVANLGDASMYSFHATKVFHTIEGGAITSKHTWLTGKLNNLKNFGITGIETVEAVGSNAKMNEFQAAMGICNLRHIEEEISKRKKVEERYRNNLEGLNGIGLLPPTKRTASNYAYFPVLFDPVFIRRNEIYEKLKEHDIFARKYFYPLASDYHCYRESLKQQVTPIAKYVSENILTLPLYADLSSREVDKICSIIKETLSY